jgi:glycerol-3-phosphate O-acyltransferase / dihydroxyacetone phosphate acyltransferase
MASPHSMIPSIVGSNRFAMLNHSLRFFILRLVELFYPRIEVDGRENLPRGPVVFVLNHPNGLLDPLVLMAGVGRHVHFLAKSTLFASAFGRWAMGSFGALPVYRQRDEESEGDRSSRNEQTFARCRVLLRAGRAMALFPEGTTHSNPMMLPLRTGAARIALSTEAEAGWGMDLRVVPIGLWYQSKSQFRSSALLVIGESFGLAGYAAAYAADPFKAVGDLTAQIDARLDTVVLQAESADVLRGLPLLAAWTAPEEPETLEQQHKRTAALLAGYQQLRASDPARIEVIAQRARRYARALRTLGIADPWALEMSAADRRRAGWLLLAVIAGFLPALAGFALSYGPYRLAAPLTPLLLGKYEETTSTGKLIIGSVLVLLGWIAAALICGALFGWVAGVVLFALAPALAYVALRWGELWHELREVAGYNWLYLRHRALVRALIARRRALAAEVVEALQVVDERKT